MARPKNQAAPVTTMPRPTAPIIAILMLGTCACAAAPIEPSCRVRLDELLPPKIESIAPPEAPLIIAVLPPLETELELSRGLFSILNGQSHYLRFGHWSEAERDAIQSWAGLGKSIGTIESVRFIPGLGAGHPAGTSSESILSLARSLGANAVLLTNQASSCSGDASLASLLDLLVVPAFVIPSREYVAESSFEAVILGLEEPGVIAASTAAHSETHWAPSITGDPHLYLADARLTTLEETLKEL